MVVTVISTVPMVPAADVAIIWVEELIKIKPLLLPNITAVAPVKLLPVIVTLVPPFVGPEFGATDDILGAAWYVNWSAGVVALVATLVVTVTSTVPAVLDNGEIALMLPSEYTL